MTSDAVGYYVAEVINGMEMYIVGTSYSKKEMIDLQKTLTIREELADIKSKSEQKVF